MATLANRPRIVRQSLAIREDQREAIFALVLGDLKHGNFSRYIQDLIDADLAERAKQAQQEAIAS